MAKNRSTRTVHLPGAYVISTVLAALRTVFSASLRATCSLYLCYQSASARPRRTRHPLLIDFAPRDMSSYNFRIHTCLKGGAPETAASLRTASKDRCMGCPGSSDPTFDPQVMHRSTCAWLAESSDEHRGDVALSLKGRVVL